RIQGNTGLTKGNQMETKRYIKLPEVLEAVQSTELNIEEVTEWCGGKISSIANRPYRAVITVPNVEGNLKAECETYMVTERTRGIDKKGSVGFERYGENFFTWGDYIVKKGNRFTVIPHEDIDNYVD